MGKLVARKLNNFPSIFYATTHSTDLNRNKTNYQLKRKLIIRRYEMMLFEFQLPITSTNYRIEIAIYFYFILYPNFQLV